jgi:7-cyano-7-deazaguanine synthase
MNEDCIVILSGGMDSTVLMYHVIEKGRNPLAVTMRYGQKHDKEIEMARKTTALCGVEHLVIDIPLQEIFTSSSLIKGGEAVPDGHYTDETQKSTVVPNRNMILLSIAAGIAEDRGISTVYYGAHANDRAIYPDCRPAFIEAVTRAAEEGTYCRVKIVAPFMAWLKADVVREGARLGVPFELTWSCYKGGETPCGTCGTCVERREAFTIAGIHDPGED